MHPLRSPRTAQCLLAASALFVGCVGAEQRVGTVPTELDAGHGDAPAVDAPAPASLADFCRGAGTTDVPGLGCNGALAQTTFRYALCSCNDWDGSASLTTDSFDSSTGSYTPGGRGGAVGTNGHFRTVQQATIAGALWVGGAGGIDAPAGLTVRADLRSAGPLGSDGEVNIGADARVGGDLRAGALAVTGTLTMPVGATIQVAGARSVGREVRGDVSVAPPCECGAASLVDVAALVAAHRSTNDNALVGLDARALADLRAVTTLALPCGRYYLAGVRGTAALSLTLSGRTAIYIDGDVALDDALRIDLGADGELDLFVTGNVSTGGDFALGSPAHPARARIYVGGAGAIAVSGAGVFAGNLYAPRATLALSAGTEVYGGIFVGRVAASSTMTVHYDTAVLSAGRGCPPAMSTPSCASCRDCGNQACVAGACGACTDSSQCCAPLTCWNGRCEPEVP